MMVERQLASEGKSRQGLGREAFVERVWEWKRHYGGAILDQMKRLGASVDWSREYFTMDDHLSVAVKEAFVRLYEQGLIYRGAYIVNWCPRCQTALSDLGSGARGATRQAVGDPLPRGRASRALPHGRDDAAGDDARRRGCGGSSGRRTLPALHGKQAELPLTGGIFPLSLTSG